MFLKNRQVWWPAQVQEVAEDGTVTVVKVPLRLVIMTKKELNAERARTGVNLQAMLAAAVASGKAVTEAELLAQYEKHDLELAARVAPRIVDWRLKEAPPEGGEAVPVPFSAENLAAAMEWDDLRQAFVTALREASSGAPIKN